MNGTHSFEDRLPEIVGWGIRAMDGCVRDKNGTYGEDGIKLINFLISHERQQNTHALISILGIKFDLKLRLMQILERSVALAKKQP